MTWTHQAVELHLGRPVTVARWRVHQGRHHGFYEVKAAAHADLFKFARIITNRFDTAFRNLRRGLGPDVQPAVCDTDFMAGTRAACFDEVSNTGSQRTTSGPAAGASKWNATK
jgi:hypothetical protein